MGVDFHRDYYESETYLLGRDLVLEGLKAGVFFQKEDSSIWVDLTDKGLDQKVLLRSDGTSVYLTQDLGTADLRYGHYQMDRNVYVVADEQNYHFKVLQLTLEKLGKPYAAGIYHLSYGLVELPHGRMKSREGNVVDADDLIREMVAAAKTQTLALGKLENPESEEAEALFRTVGMGALKFFMLRVDPKKKMLFNPEESIDLQGQTGPFVQYTYARIQSIKAKVGEVELELPEDYQLSPLEKEMLVELYQYPAIVQEAANHFDPSVVASYAYNLAKTFNKFYVDHSIANAETPAAKHLRMGLSQLTSKVLAGSFKLLGIEVPERM
jgi:arginyl-tRNA synthetase